MNFPSWESLRQPLNPSLGKSLQSQRKWEVLRSQGPQVPSQKWCSPTSAGQMLLSTSSNIWPARVFGIYHPLVMFTAKLFILKKKTGFRGKKKSM